MAICSFLVTREAQQMSQSAAQVVRCIQVVVSFVHVAKLERLWRNLYPVLAPSKTRASSLKTLLLSLRSWHALHGAAATVKFCCMICCNCWDCGLLSGRQASGDTKYRRPLVVLLITPQLGSPRLAQPWPQSCVTQQGAKHQAPSPMHG